MNYQIRMKYSKTVMINSINKKVEKHNDIGNNSLKFTLEFGIIYASFISDK